MAIASNSQGIKKAIKLIAILICLSVFFPQGRDLTKAHGVSFPNDGLIKGGFGRLPLYFIQNKGELDNSVRFYEKGNGHATFFTRDGVYLLLEKAKVEAEVEGGITPTPPSPLEGEGKGGGGEVIKLSFLGANKRVEPTGEGPQEGKVNYFIGNDPAKWKTDIPIYQAVVYKDIYPGIDMKFYGNSQQLEYDIIMKPGADPSKVRLSYEIYMSLRLTREDKNNPPIPPLAKWGEGGFEGIEGLRITEEGDLEIDLTPTHPSPAGGEGKRGGGKIIQKRPYVYQEIDGKKVEVEGGFKMLNGGCHCEEQGDEAIFTPTPPSPLEGEGKGEGEFIYGFEIASYDKRYPLIIDPVLVYSTYMGGSSGDGGNGIDIDTSGNIYITGSTSSIDFPKASSTHKAIKSSSDAFVAKIDPSGKNLTYLTYLGGSSYDQGHSIAVDSSGNAYVTGSTHSSDFQTKDPLQSFSGGHYDAFMAKLDPTGSKLIYSTYLGGSDFDEGYSITVDSSGSAYVIGSTRSTDFPTKNPFQPVFGSKVVAPDAFVVKLDPNGSELIYSTYLGGDKIDNGLGIKVDSSGNAYVTGWTNSNKFPRKNPLQSVFGGDHDAFIAKLDPTGSTLIYSTYLGGNRNDEGFSIALDPSGSVYVTGRTGSTDFPTKNPLQRASGGLNDAFVAKLDTTGSKLIYSTYLGGSNFDEGYSIAVDSSGNAYVTGVTLSGNFPTKNPLQPTPGGEHDTFVAKLNAKGDALVYSTYLGGSDLDHGRGIAIDPSGNAHVTGGTQSTNFSTKNPLQATSGGGSDAFLVKITDTPQKGKR